MLGLALSLAISSCSETRAQCTLYCVLHASCKICAFHAVLGLFIHVLHPSAQILSMSFIMRNDPCLASERKKMNYGYDGLGSCWI